jgi:hypothetical protein
VSVDQNGVFQFIIDTVNEIPNGEYYLRVDFNGTITESAIFLSDYLIHSTCSPININITAGTSIIQQDYYTLTEDTYPNYWVSKDTLFVIGDLTWDNGSAISGMTVNVTVKLIDGTVIDFNDTVTTNEFGAFNASIYIDPNNDKWPLLRSDSEIWVYFNPVQNGLNYAESSTKLFI